MKFIILAIILPCVFGECPPLPNHQVPCDPPHLICSMIGPDGCPAAPACQWVNPYERCSNRPRCPVMCLPDQMSCWGGVDAEGCPMADICVPLDTSTANCPNSGCPLFCQPNENKCDGGPDPNDPNGCPLPDSCIIIDPTVVCPAWCPPTPCALPEFACDGGQDQMGCVRPPMCSVNGECPAI